MANSQTPAELKNCTLENPSLLLGSLARYLGSDKQWILSAYVTFAELNFGIRGCIYRRKSPCNSEDLVNVLIATIS